MEVLQKSFSDWHPVAHTIHTIMIPLVITGGWVGSVALFQIIAFSFAITYMITVIYDHSGKGFAIASYLFIILNPQTRNMAVYVWKDTAFSIYILLLTTFVVQIYFTTGKWLEKKRNILIYIIVAVLATLMRHNGILYTFPITIAMLFIGAKKRYVAICFSFVVVVLLLRGPVYTALNITMPGGRLTEVLGTPLNIIASVAKYDPEALDGEAQSFVYELAPKAVWEKIYEYGDFDTVKFHADFNNEVVDKWGVKNIFLIAARCLYNSPIYALKGLIKLTEVSYTITSDYTYFSTPIVADNTLGLKLEGISILQKIHRMTTGVCMLFLPHIFVYCGSMHYIFLGSILAKVKTGYGFLIVIPTLINNFVSSFITTAGPWHSCRYYYYTFLIVPILILVLYKKRADV